MCNCTHSVLRGGKLPCGDKLRLSVLSFNEARQFGQKHYHHPFPDNAFVSQCWRFLCTQLMVRRPWLIIDGGAYSGTSPQCVFGQLGRLGMGARYTANVKQVAKHCQRFGKRPDFNGVFSRQPSPSCVVLCCTSWSSMIFNKLGFQTPMSLSFPQ